ncbi:hypothetical protein AN414_02775 [Serratia marcescens]|nr:hypothetical protein AN414_02775 [Serratia marcescens]
MEVKFIAKGSFQPLKSGTIAAIADVIENIFSATHYVGCIEQGIILCQVRRCTIPKISIIS